MDHMYFLRPFLPKLGKIEGITEDEIAGLETQYNVTLPEAYKQYMMIFGRKNGIFMERAGMRMDELEDIHESYQEDLVSFSSYTPIPLGDNWYFFGMDGGSFLYFECDGNPDPKVWTMLGVDIVKEVYPSFTAFLKEEVDVKSKRWM